MYVSPINMIIDDFQTEVVKEGENYICKAVQKVGIDVDKDELVKALMYDRGQYEKGYEDGLKANKWIPVSEKVPSDCGCDWVLAQVQEDSGYLWMPQVMEYNPIKDDWCSINEHLGWLKDHNGIFKVVAWMPLPEPWKESEE